MGHGGRAQNSTLHCNESFWSNAWHWMQKYRLSTPNTRLVYWTCTVPLFKNSYTPRTVHVQYTNGPSGVASVYARIACPGTVERCNEFTRTQCIETIYTKITSNLPVIWTVPCPFTALSSLTPTTSMSVGCNSSVCARQRVHDMRRK